MPKKQSKPKVASVELYLNECFPCHQSKYIELYDWYISMGLPLRNFQTKRIVLSHEWLDYARKLKKDKGIDAPFVVIKTDDGGEQIFTYEDFKKKGMKMFTKKEQDEIRSNIMTKKIEVVEEVKEKRKTKTKKANLTKTETISTDIEE